MNRCESENPKEGIFYVFRYKKFRDKDSTFMDQSGITESLLKLSHSL